MSEKSRRLLDALTHLPDRALDEALDYRPRRRPHLRWAAAAACLCLAVGFGAWLLPRLGGSQSGAGGAGHDEASEFLHYAGPILPLTAAEDTAVTAARTVTLDFAPWTPQWRDNETEAGGDAEYLALLEEHYPEGGRFVASDDLLVTDEYVLTNPAGADETLTLLYPFAGSLTTAAPYIPTLAAEGSPLETTLLAGGYSGGFAPVYGAEDGGLWNLSPASWEDYQALLASSGYLASALGEAPDLSQIPAVLYTFSDPWGPAVRDDAPNPTIRASYAMDYGRTVTLSYGFNGGSYDREAGLQARSFSIPRPDALDAGRSFYLIVLGDDITGLTLSCHGTGGWDTAPALEGGATVTRTETTLGAALEPILDDLYGALPHPEGSPMEDEALFDRLYRGHLAAYVLGEDAPARYSDGMLENLDVANADRIFYLAAEVTVPAGGSVTVTASFRKGASYDFSCVHTENEGVRGYDLLTAAHRLALTSQTAVLEDRGQIAVVRQNFGFDPAAGVTRVALDDAVPRYYLEVRRADA